MTRQDKAVLAALAEVVIGLTALWLINKVGEAIDQGSVDDDLDFMLVSCSGDEPRGLGGRAGT